ncbi:hypothetical protein [Acidovorax temperans]
MKNLVDRYSVHLGLCLAGLAWLSLAYAGYAWVFFPEPAFDQPGLGRKYFSMFISSILTVPVSFLALFLGLEGILRRRNREMSKLVVLLSSPILLLFFALVLWINALS